MYFVCHLYLSVPERTHVELQAFLQQKTFALVTHRAKKEKTFPLNNS